MMKQNEIRCVRAREIISGRGIPAVEVEVKTSAGFVVRASSPSGTSVAAHEALEVRDPGTRYGGKGVLKAVENVNSVIGPALIGIDTTKQHEIDHLMIALDGTSHKSKLGGNALTATSLAVAKAGAISVNLELYQYIGGVRASRLPIVCLNMISGSPTAGNNLDFEDYLLCPYGFESFSELLEASIKVFHVLHQRLESDFGPIPQITALAPPLKTNEDAFAAIVRAIDEAGYSGRIGVGIDAAVAQLYDEERERYIFRNGTYTRDELIDYYAHLASEYPLLFIEDGLHEDDFEGFAQMTTRLPMIIIGDDLFATNTDRLMTGRDIGAANAILFKVNQAGTVSEAVSTAETAHVLNYTVVASTRSGETNDAAQADLAVGIGARMMKLGCPLRGEMVAKYNRLLKIEEHLGAAAGIQTLPIAPGIEQ